MAFYFYFLMYLCFAQRYINKKEDISIAFQGSFHRTEDSKKKRVKFVSGHNIIVGRFNKQGI